jgi:uncharacterized membrane protein
MNRLELIWTHLRSSFWFLPMLIYAASIVIAVALVEADAGNARGLIDNWPRLFGSGAAGARGMLSTIAGSMMTVVGVTFSMTLVTLALASSQYTSRILRNFMADRLTQIVLGVFGGIFIYCLIVLRTIRGGEEDYVPSFAVLFGVMLAIGGITMLIFFIHHIASSIQASSIIESVTQETLAAIDRLLPSEKDGEDQAPGDRPVRTAPLDPGPGQKVTATRIGYIQSIDVATALRVAAKHEAIVRLEHGVGEFIVNGTVLASITSQAPMPEDAVNGLAKAFNIYRFRTVDQDPGFGIRQIVDIALRALSPSVNDTTTAAMCVDYLSAILAHVVDREFPSGVHRHEGAVRVISVEQTFASLLGGAFDQIRSCARGNLSIIVRMLEALQRLAASTRDVQRRKPLAEYLDCMTELRDSLGSVYERDQFDATLRRARVVMRQ